MTNLSSWLALNLVPDLGAAGARRLLEKFGSPQAIFENLARLDECRWLTHSQVKALQKMPSRASQIEDYLLAIEEQGIQILTIDSDNYPENLRPLPDAPLLLYLAGSLIPQDAQAVASVGTRTPTPAGEEMAYRLAAAFARCAVTVVSGLAMGIDTAAHVGCLEAGGRTIAVVGSGLFRVTPAGNRELSAQITQSGAVVSEYPPHLSASAKRLMIRNRIQAGLSLGVLVVEAREKGGALATAKHARRYGRRLLAVKWPQEKEEAEGPNALIEEHGAIAVSGPEDVEALVEMLKTPAEAAPHSRSLPFGVDAGDPAAWPTPPDKPTSDTGSWP